MQKRGYSNSSEFSSVSSVPTTPDSAIMIVAIPNPTRTSNFGLVDVNTDNMKTFRFEAKNLGDALIPWEYALSNNYGVGVEAAGSTSTLRVNRIGNYDISVAPSLEALDKQIDWSHFTLPKDFDRRKATLSDKTLFPYPCAYVVAKAVKSVKNDGFAILFPDPGFTYFPTCHENTSNGYNEYDVRCYQFGNKDESTFPFKVFYDKSEMNDYKDNGNKKYCFNSFEGYKRAKIGEIPFNKSVYAPSFTTTDLKSLRSILSYLPNSAIMSETGKTLSINCDNDSITCMNYCPINTKTINQNIEIYV